MSNPHKQENNNTNHRKSLCGNCKHFVVGGLCELVRGQINSKSTCDLHEFGDAHPIDYTVDPKHTKTETNYKPGFFVETITKNGTDAAILEITSKAEQMYYDLIQRGVPPREAHRATVAYYSDPTPPAIPWPGPVTGLDLAGNINGLIVPDTGTPLTDFTGLPKDVQPYPTPNKSPYGIGGESSPSQQPYRNSPTPDPNSIGGTSNTYEFKNYPAVSSSNWIGTASNVNSEPSMHGEHGYTVTQSIPPWRYDIEQSQMYPTDKKNDIILPPSGAGTIMESSQNTTKKPLKELCNCMNVTLPSVRLDLSNGGTNEMSVHNNNNNQRKKLQEAISNLRNEFEWLTDEYVDSAKKLTEDAGGTLYLVRAAGETLTDHRSEGESHRRKLSADELNSMTRTMIGKTMDINHQPEFKTDSTILDAEFDKIRKEIQSLIIVRDPQINRAIDNGTITAVSINGGLPRSESIEPCEDDCTDDDCELCLVPHGVVLGELDDIGMTFVITDPNGMYWDGHHVSPAEPGIKFTKLEKI